MQLTIITINLNNYEGLKKTIDSIRCQTWRNFEWIVIDGGSTDGSTALIESEKNNLAYWCSEPDKGVYNAMNKGVEKASGQYVLFMNSGDCLHDEKVLEDIFQDKQYSADILIGKVLHVGSNVIVNKYGIDSGLLDYWDIIKGINHQGAFTKLKVLKKYPFDENFVIISDRKFWLQTLVQNNCTVYVLDRLVADYDLTGISSTNKELYAKEEREIMKQLFSPALAYALQDYKSIRESVIYVRLTYMKHHYPLLYKLSQKMLAVILLFVLVTNKKIYDKESLYYYKAANTRKFSFLCFV